ncbi:sigma-54-dependent transcriptional regulator [Sulfitobacter donghicola]|uniref:Nif-specific regulatory protein n=1 Tax=Sulfitobacter donghicola DSW-25 = KCTC 12864 = JCM 14565 TaxID=1300350 RepID=A0A073IGM4_9RHOB|nr:sigma-54 dependent transcriptional regulator [Sulfitobacter donghicola]KEJ88646.1 chemotaxis protein CheY [Sulfitobacter donghicola DSW-25 = KCTC 12864 = JCM 14565]KIN68414.1 Two component, sigma54 specific, transcriptional regulator, Fis family [Sulfitobacter donghicola DSW-25 = KCTC 12864 = JCM 14565]
METNTTSDYGPALAGASILIVDDEVGMRHFLQKILLPRVKRVELAGSAAEATKHLDNAHFDVVILDNLMPGKTGLNWVKEQRQIGLYADVIMMTAYADLETAIAALRVGISDFILKPFRANQILSSVMRTLDRSHLQRDNHLLRHELSAGRAGAFLGRSVVFEDVRNMLARLAPLPTSVLFTGESGTGKEIAARTLHSLSSRSDKPFVAVNCAAFAPDKIMQQLFGERDGEGNNHHGLLFLADGGTLFLDEVAQMPDALQTALLRVLDDQRVRPVGSEREIPLDLRLLFATNANLEEAVAKGTFRADLYHRMNVVNVHMPKLSDRSEDIVELAAHFMQQLSKELGMVPLELDAGTLLKMRRYDWPGNVREMRNLIERSVILGEFPPEFAGDGDKVTGEAATESLDLVMQRHILHILDQSDGNRAEAARRLGVSRKTIDRKCAAWGF